MGIDWWEGDPFLGRGGQRSLDQRLKRLEAASGIESDDGGGDRDTGSE
jgi:hypothetical protein